MSGKLSLLLSSGSIESPYRELIALLPKKPNELRLVFILTASKPNKDKTALNRARTSLMNLGFGYIQDYDLEGKNQEKLAADLDSFDVIYIAGGNSFYLLYHMKKSGFDKIIKQLLLKKVYIGVSAGSTVTGPSIDLSLSENNVGLSDTKGLDLFPFSVISHYKPSERESIEKRVKKVNQPVVALADGGGLLCQGDNYKTVGTGPFISFNNFRKIL